MDLKGKIIITGAGGLVGSYAINAFHRRGMNVIGVYNSQPSEKLPWPVVISDLTKTSIENCNLDREDIIVHCAAKIPLNFADADQTYSTNKLIDENILLSAAQYNTGLVYISSTSLYGQSGLMLTEDDQVNITNEYSRAKFETEQEISKLHIDKKIILRLNAPYGPEQRNNTVLKIFIERAIAGLPLFYLGNGSRQQDFTSVTDIARAILCSIFAEPEHSNGIYNISGGAPISMKSLAEMVVSLIPNCKSVVLTSNEHDENNHSRALYSIQKAKDKLKWQPVISLKQGITNWINFLNK